ncbi:MAG: hypothetical protein GY701_20600 [Sulfitobacter sp.]|nr:hypothetical protein [Sulfitobacter sp.]
MSSESNSSPRLAGYRRLYACASVGSKGDRYDNAMIESFNGLYNGAGGLASLNDLNNQTTVISTDGDGRTTQMVRANSYDAAGRLTGTTHSDTGGTVESFTYTLDASGNRIGVSSSAGTENVRTAMPVDPRPRRDRQEQRGPLRQDGCSMETQPPPRELRIDEAIDRGPETFLEAWFGPPPDSPATPVVDAPQALGRWWAWETAWGRSLSRQNTMLRPEERFEDGDQTVFYVEAQAVMIWGYGTGDDPPVSERENDDSSPWSPLGLRLSEFLSQVLVFEASFGPHYLVVEEAGPGGLNRITNGLVQFACTVWPGAPLYLGRRVIVNALPLEGGAEPRAGWMVVVSGASPSDLDELADRADWDTDSRTGTWPGPSPRH